MFVVTFMAANFGTIIYLRPATIATDCGGDVTFASNCNCDCACVRFVAAVFLVDVVGAVMELVLDALLPLCNAVVDPVELLFRDDRSRCLVDVAAVTIGSDPVCILPATAVDPLGGVRSSVFLPILGKKYWDANPMVDPVADSVDVCGWASAAMQRCVMGMSRGKEGK